MLPAARSVACRRRVVGILVVVPAALVLTLPAYAGTAVEVTASDEQCGLRLAVHGLTAGEHRVAVTVTASASGEVVPALPTDAPAATADTADTADETADTAADTPGAPAVTAELPVSGDEAVLVALDPDAVPDDDARLEVAVAVDGAPAGETALTLDTCSATSPATPEPTPSTSAEPTPSTSAEPTPSTSAEPTPSTSAEPTPSTSAEPTPSTSAEPTPSTSAEPSPTTTPTTSPNPTTSSAPVPSGSPGAGLADPAAAPTGPVTSSPGSAPEPTSLPAPGTPVPWTPPPWSGPVLRGTGRSSLPSLSWGTSTLPGLAPQAPVPAPVIAPPADAPAVLGSRPVATRRPLDELLGVQQDAVPAPAPADDAVLAAPRLSTVTASDPVTDLTPAAFVLAAWVGGMLTAGRRRTR